jgi:hypothetical protein
MEKVRGVPSYLETGTVVGDKSYRNIVGLRGLERRNQFKCSFTFVKEMELSSPAQGLKSLREDPTHGKQREMEFDTSWSVYMYM